VVWIAPGWLAERLYPCGLRDFADPARLILARARRPEDLMWAMEESLRTGAVGLVVCELAAPPGLTPVRRLHLAAEAGAEAARHRGRIAPLGVLLTPGAGGAQGIESRWQLAALPTEASGGANLPVWRLDRLRARMQPPAEWRLQHGPGGAGYLAERRGAAEWQTMAAGQPRPVEPPSSAPWQEPG
jgi:protein ImuA